MQELKDSKKIKLSILICSVNNRVDNFLQSMIRQIDAQMADGVEVLTLIDNKKMTIGRKRNLLLKMAKGEYVVFVDDDDTIAPNYISELLKGTNTGKDVICFNANISINGGDYKLVQYSHNLTHGENELAYTRQPNHLMCWKNKVFVPFEDISFGEDTIWASNMLKFVESEHYIDKVLYYYDYSDRTSESTKHRK